MRDSLQDRLEEQTAGTLPQRLQIALQLARILRAWHRIGKYHGRLSTETVLVSASGRVTLLASDAPPPATEIADVQAFGRILSTLLVPVSPLTGNFSPLTAETLPDTLATLRQQTLAGHIGMKQVVELLEKCAAGTHPWHGWIRRKSAGLVGLLGLLTATAWFLIWLSFS